MKRKRTLLRALISVAWAWFIGATWIVPVLGQSKLEPYYSFLRPDGQGPFPALMLVPGSPGIVGNRSQQAEALKEQGYVVVFVDYVSARGLPTGSGNQVPRQEIVDDIKEVGSYLQSLSFVDPSRIGAIGWSRGAVAILMTVAEASKDQLPFKAAAVFYPSCRGVRPWETKVPILMLLGAADDATPAEHCQNLVKELPPDYPVDVRVYADARHSFDRSDLPSYRRRRVRGGSIGYNARAAAEAWEKVRKFFGRHFRQP